MAYVDEFYIAGGTQQWVPLIDHNGQIERFARERGLLDWGDRSQVADPVLSHVPMRGGQHALPLPRAQWLPRPRLSINQLYFPQGATRYGELTILMDRDEALSLIGYSQRSRPRYGAASTMDWPPGHGLDEMTQDQPVSIYYGDPSVRNNPLYRYGKFIDWYVTDWRPVCDDLWLVRLCDKRFWWQLMTFGGTCITSVGPPPCLGGIYLTEMPNRYSNWPTWDELFEYLRNQLFIRDSVTNYYWNCGAVPEDYLYPDPDTFGRPYESVAAILEAAALSVGRRVLYDPYHRVAVWPLASIDNPSPFVDVSYDHLRVEHGGYHQAGIRGDHVLVVFPHNLSGHVVQDQILTGHVEGVRGRYWWVAVPITGALSDDTAYATVTVYDPTDVAWSDHYASGNRGVWRRIYSTCHACFLENATEPYNSDEVRLLARRIARDYVMANRYHWRRDYTLPQLGAMPPHNTEDYRIVDFGSAGEREYEIKTTVVETQGPDGSTQKESHPELVEVYRPRHGVRIFSTQEDLGNSVNASQWVSTPLIQDECWFIPQHDLLPGESVTAIVDPDDEQAVNGPGVGTECTITDTHYLACVVASEGHNKLLCRWNHSTSKWVITQPFGLMRRVVITNPGGIAASSWGTCEIYKDFGTPTGVEIDVWLHWMDMGQDLAEGDEAVAVYDRAFNYWWFLGAECPPGTYPEPPS